MHIQNLHVHLCFNCCINNKMWEFLDKVIYINLDHREDRRKIMEKLCIDARIPEEKVLRFSAIKHQHGIVGAALSHISVLKLAKEQRYKRILILEDDMEFVDFETNYLKLEKLISTNIWMYVCYQGCI